MQRSGAPVAPRDFVAGAGAFVVATVAMMIVPLPTPLLDVLLTSNLAISVALLLVAVWSARTLELSTFPTLLLLTTLYRLALNVSSVRLILLQADAGRVIHAFGAFVVRGDYVVGFAVFLILTIVQYVVISRGAERVAEVAARFTLDAMPGKQLAIDADLRAGAIDADEARRRRDALSKEAALYGALDGAMRFVKGDAIAGILILAISLVGGLVIGVVQRGMALGDAARVYTLLTIGDGLVSQLPALLISTAAGPRGHARRQRRGRRARSAPIWRASSCGPRALVTTAVLLARARARARPAAAGRSSSSPPPPARWRGWRCAAARSEPRVPVADAPHAPPALEVALDPALHAARAVARGAPRASDARALRRARPHRAAADADHRRARCRCAATRSACAASPSPTASCPTAASSSTSRPAKLPRRHRRAEDRSSGDGRAGVVGAGVVGGAPAGDRPGRCSTDRRRSPRASTPRCAPPRPSSSASTRRSASSTAPRARIRRWCARWCRARADLHARRRRAAPPRRRRRRPARSADGARSAGARRRRDARSGAPDRARARPAARAPSRTSSPAAATSARSARRRRRRGRARRAPLRRRRRRARARARSRRRAPRQRRQRRRWRTSRPSS